MRAGLRDFGQKLALQEFWAGSGDFQAETKMRRLLGKVRRVFVRVKTKQLSGKKKPKRFSVRSLKCAGS